MPSTLRLLDFSIFPVDAGISPKGHRDRIVAWEWEGDHTSILRERTVSTTDFSDGHRWDRNLKLNVSDLWPSEKSVVETI
jgi:hypothetical protein